MLRPGAVDAWAYQHHLAMDFIQPGKPMQNGFGESFNGKFRDGCLDRHWFTSLDDAIAVIAARA
jgi:putative transposase